MVARALGRYPVHMDLSADYLRLAQWRIYESGHAAKTVTRTNGERRGAGRGDLVNLPAVTGDDQLDLFGGAA